MITQLTQKRVLLPLGFVGLGVDAGLWLAPHVPSICISDALLCLISISVSALATGAGLGGAVLMVPVLLVLHRMNVVPLPPQQIGTLAALSAAIASGIGSQTHRRHGTVVWRTSWKMGVVGSMVAVLTAHWVYHWPPLFVVGADALMASLAVLFLWIAPRHSGSPRAPHLETALVLCATAGVGVSSGITGMPGSFLLIPAVLWITRLPYRQAVGTVLQAIFFLAISTFLMKLHQDLFNLEASLPVILGSLAGSTLGSQWGLGTSIRTLRLLATATIILGSAFALALS